MPVTCSLSDVDEVDDEEAAEPASDRVSDEAECARAKSLLSAEGISEMSDRPIVKDLPIMGFGGADTEKSWTPNAQPCTIKQAPLSHACLLGTSRGLVAVG